MAELITPRNLSATGRFVPRHRGWEALSSQAGAPAAPQPLIPMVPKGPNAPPPQPPPIGSHRADFCSKHHLRHRTPLTSTTFSPTFSSNPPPMGGDPQRRPCAARHLQQRPPTPTSIPPRGRGSLLIVLQLNLKPIFAFKHPNPAPCRNHDKAGSRPAGQLRFFLLTPNSR